MPDDFDYIGGELEEMEDRIKYIDELNKILQKYFNHLDPRIEVASRRMSFI
jgi:hypothetical protein